jgi:hypothetical protein
MLLLTEKRFKKEEEAGVFNRDIEKPLTDLRLLPKVIRRWIILMDPWTGKKICMLSRMITR